MKCSERRYVKANPADRLAGWSHFSQNYTTDTYRYRASSVGGRPYGCIGQCNKHATSEPWLGKYCLGWGAIRNLVIGDAQDAQRRMLIIHIKMIVLYSIRWAPRRPRQDHRQVEWPSGSEPLQASAASPATPQTEWCQSAALRFGGSATCGAFRRDEMRCPASAFVRLIDK